MEEKPRNWGGARRQGTTRTNRTFSIDNDLIEDLKAQTNINNFVNDAIREKLKLIKKIS